MALRSGYKGYKKLAEGLKEFWPGILGVDNAALSKTFFPRSEQAVLGAKNRLPITLDALKIANNRGTWSGNVYTDSTGVTFTVTEENGYVTTITANGAASGNVSIFYVKNANFDGKYIVNGCPSGGEWGDTQKYRIRIGKYDGTFLQTDLGSGVEATFPSGGGAEFQINTGVGYTCNNLAFKLMARDVNDPDSTYAPFAMTNEELTGAVAIKVVDIKTDFKTALMEPAGATVTDVENATLITFGKLAIINARLNKAANTAISYNVTLPFTLIPKLKTTVYANLNSSSGAGTASLASGSSDSTLALRYGTADGTTYVDMTVVALLD